MGWSCSKSVELQPDFVVEVREVENNDWVRLGGEELEVALREAWVKLVRADWLVQHAESGGVLRRRQEMPPEAYVGLDELKQAGSMTLRGNSTTTECLWVMVLSYPWLQPGHPDPYGEHLRALAKLLKHFVTDTPSYSNKGKPYGVLIDFTALFQEERTKDEYEIFLLALPALNRFYSHPSTLVLKITQFPDRYPNHPERRYILPEGANRVDYDDRGWCFAEACMSGLVKSSNKVLDLGHSGGSTDSMRGLFEVVGECKTTRKPPLHPDDFIAALHKKTFTSPSADFVKVTRLYSAAFEKRLGSATELDYSGLKWDAGAAQQLVRALRGNSSLEKLDVSRNGSIGEQGAVALAETLKTSTALHTLSMAGNNVGPGGAVALAAALQSNGSLRTLTLHSNASGDRGAIALGQALVDNSSLQTLYLNNNNIGDAGAIALGQALQTNTSLQALYLRVNDIADEGALALAEALRGSKALRKLDLQCNTFDRNGSAGDVLREAAGSRPADRPLDLLL